MTDKYQVFIDFDGTLADMQPFTDEPHTEPP
jgi:hypothetical protein